MATEGPLRRQVLERLAHVVPGNSAYPNFAVWHDINRAAAPCAIASGIRALVPVGAIQDRPRGVEPAAHRRTDPLAHVTGRQSERVANQAAPKATAVFPLPTSP